MLAWTSKTVKTAIEQIKFVQILQKLAVPVRHRPYP